MSRTTIGIILSLFAGACLSTGGIALRLVEDASGFQILFYRALSFFTLMTLALAILYRRRFPAAVRSIGTTGLWVALLLGLGATAYVFAILHTTVANAVVILSTAPLLTAFLAWLTLGQRISLATAGAAVAALFGVTIMVVDGLGGSGVMGMVIALAAASSYAVMLVLLQRRQGVDMLPATALSGVVTLVIALIAAPNLAISGHDLAVAAFLGSFQFGLGFACITLAARYIDGAMVALLSLSEVVLAPIWVWVGVGETPTANALMGGLIVLAAVVSQMVSAMRSEPDSLTK